VAKAFALRPETKPFGAAPPFMGTIANQVSSSGVMI
jgi:hypothetical protein